MVATVALASLAASTRDSEPGRIRSGALAIYDFDAVRDDAIRDLIPRSPDSHLRIVDSRSVRVLPGAVELLPGGLLRSRSRAAKLADMVGIGSELSLEAWIRPARAEQDGPAAILALSNGSDPHNFLLGQDGGRFVARFRTSKTGRDGGPGLSTRDGHADSELTHLVFTRDRTGRARLYLDGAMAVEGQIPGGVEVWEKATLWFGGGPSSDRP